MADNATQSYLETILKDYGDDKIGYPSSKVVRKLYELGGDTLDEQLKELVFGEHRSIKAMILHEPIDNGKDGNWYRPVAEDYVKYLQMMIANRYSKRYSVREATELLEGLGFTVSSNGQLNNIWNRAETKLGLKDKRRGSIKYKEAKKKAREELGKQRQYVQTKARTKQLEDARKIRSERILQEKLKKEQELSKARLTKMAAKQGKTYSELKATKEEREAKEGKLKETHEVEKTKDRIQKSGKKVIYEPTEKQAEFHSADEDVVLYGGAAGGGKSYAMLVDALRYCQHEDYRGLIIRRTSPMLKELIGVSRTLYPKAFPGAKYNKAENVWYFPSGATIQFGYLDKPEDIENYQGLPYAYIGFDEVQHQRSDEGFIYLMSRLRSANPEIKCYIRASANPGGAPWVKELFIDSAEANTTFTKGGLTYRFIPANLSDNPYLDTPMDGEELSPYRKMLMALPEVKRKQLLEGDWQAGEDAMFSFNPALHVIDELPPEHWSIISAHDYGYKDPAATLWGAICPRTNQIVIYQEHEVTQHDHVSWAKSFKEAEGYIPQGVDRVIDHTVFNQSGHTGPGVREQLARLGVMPRPADKNREAGWNQLHQRLLIDPSTGEPQLLIHSSCEKLIEQLQTAEKNPKKPDDILEKRMKSKGRTHHWDLLDTLRYLLMARPSAMTLADRSLRYKSESDGYARYSGYFR